MPNYTYTDGKEEIIVIHPFEWEGTIISGSGVQMWRKPPQNVGVNWNGLSPSAAEWVSPEIKEHIRTADAQRDEYERKHEHE